MIPAAECALQKRYYARDENHGGYNVTSSRIILGHAKCRGEDERYRDYGTDHRQVMLKIKLKTDFQIL